MTRKQKISLLEAFKCGKIGVEVINPPITHIFYQYDSKPFYYTKDNRVFSQEEFKTFLNKIENNNNFLLKNFSFSKEDLENVIVISFVEGATIL